MAWWRSDEYYDSAAWRGTWALDGGGALMNQPPRQLPSRTAPYRPSTSRTDMSLSTPTSSRPSRTGERRA
ncbi:hypothetical protein [Kribbella sp. NBC_01245]|uniref:hypothetical protein n=1 Tax=Kribbella sp. NBC_01245 TaxID=2903578 RepID=UPI003FA5E3BD